MLTHVHPGTPPRLLACLRTLPHAGSENRPQRRTGTQAAFQPLRWHVVVAGWNTTNICRRSCAPQKPTLGNSLGESFRGLPARGGGAERRRCRWCQSWKLLEHLQRPSPHQPELRQLRHAKRGQCLKLLPLPLPLDWAAGSKLAVRPTQPVQKRIFKGLHCLQYNKNRCKGSVHFTGEQLQRRSRQAQSNIGMQWLVWLGKKYCGRYDDMANIRG